ncbi:sugar ABC transporter permease [Acetivibrio ethanolgignens]|uniref:Maltose/maltodextrin transport system permease protein n=1 Tax=Acetivibrio ethanolgignens TaxID=290052 RepID=A0A0V8QHI3_9FIRM|nr:sugar ABC transporter permease [Acetivibrio ethanolgignens]
MKKKTPALSKKVNPDSLISALKNGNPIVWLSCLIMGLGNIAMGQLIKGFLFLAIEIAVIYFLVMSNGGFYWISMLPSLGDRPMQEIWNDDKGIYEYIQGDNSQLILLYGIASICIIIVFIIIWRTSVCSGYKALDSKRNQKHIPGFMEDVKSLFDENVHKLLMATPFTCLLIFTILPLLYMICMAFTNYSKEGDHLVLFDWVGLQNFEILFSANSTVGKQFWSVLGWTIVWAIFATFLNFIFGTLMAMVINRKSIKLKGLWRGCLSMTIAVPQFVSLMVIRSMMQPEGIINRMLMNNGYSKLPFLTDATWARVMVIIVNLWIGIPYTIMQVTGILQNIPEEQYESSRIDGANVVQQFVHITLPYMLFVLTPYLITQFTGNINNFNVIYLLTRGEPVAVGNTAGATDLLVTWLYKLSVDQQKYNIGAVIGIFTFIVLTVISLITYRNSGSYKDEEVLK